MVYEGFSDEEIGSGRPLGEEQTTKMKDNFDALYGQTFGSGLPNPSFEIDSDDDSKPDQWYLGAYSNMPTLETSTVIEGSSTLKMVHPGGAGNGGGYAMSDYIPCCAQKSVEVDLVLYSTAAGMKNMVRLYWYDEDQIGLTGGDIYTTIYSSTSNPTSATPKVLCATPPSDAKWCKVVLFGGYNDTDVAGTTYFDAVQVRMLPNYATGYDRTIATSGMYEIENYSALTKQWEYTMDRGGSIGTVLSFQMLSDDVNSVQGRIYVNGVATGTSRSHSNEYFTEYTETISGLEAGDTVELWLGSSTVTGTSYCHGTLELMHEVP